MFCTARLQKAKIILQRAPQSGQRILIIDQHHAAIGANNPIFVSLKSQMGSGKPKRHLQQFLRCQESFWGQAQHFVALVR